jgi:hypothetical protein
MITSFKMMSLLYVIFISLVTAIVVDGQNCSTTLPALPEDVRKAKVKIVELANANIDKWGDDNVQSFVRDQAAILENWYKDNRPDFEVELSLGSWLCIWYEDPPAFYFPFLFGAYDRRNTYQIIRDGFFYNVAKIDQFSFLRFRVVSSTTLVKGSYTIKSPKISTSCGQKRRNTMDVSYVSATLRQNWLSSLNMSSIVDIIDDIDAGDIPRGRALAFINQRGLDIFPNGDLWNLYVDNDLRVAYGIDAEAQIDEGRLYVFVRRDPFSSVPK